MKRLLLLATLPIAACALMLAVPHSLGEQPMPPAQGGPATNETREGPLDGGRPDGGRPDGGRPDDGQRPPPPQRDDEDRGGPRDHMGGPRDREAGPPRGFDGEDRGLGGPGRGPGGMGGPGGPGGMLMRSPTMDTMRGYMELVVRYGELSKDPSMAGVSAVLTANDLLRPRGAQAGIDYFVKLLPDVKDPTVQRAIRLQLIELYRRAGQNDEALKQLEMLIKGT